MLYSSCLKPVSALASAAVKTARLNRPIRSSSPCEIVQELFKKVLEQVQELVHEVQMTGSKTLVLKLFKTLVVLEPGSRIHILEHFKN